MIKFIALAFTITAVSLTSMFAECPESGGCGKKKGDKKDDKDKEKASYVIQL